MSNSIQGKGASHTRVCTKNRHAAPRQKPTEGIPWACHANDSRLTSAAFADRFTFNRALVVGREVLFCGRQIREPGANPGRPRRCNRTFFEKSEESTNLKSHCRAASVLNAASINAAQHDEKAGSVSVRKSEDLPTRGMQFSARDGDWCENSFARKALVAAA
jgi:hypothetical protein